MTLPLRSGSSVFGSNVLGIVAEVQNGFGKSFVEIEKLKSDV